jgi:hypothetical protein
MKTILILVLASLLLTGCLPPRVELPTPIATTCITKAPAPGGCVPNCAAPGWVCRSPEEPR